MTASVAFALPPAEADHLQELVDQYLELVTAPDDPRDPAAKRLSPDAYPDDADAAAEFRALTRDDVAATRASDARLVLATLTRAAQGRSVDPASGDGLTLGPQEQTAWLRTLAGLRLVLAERIGISDESIMPVGDPRFDVYEWLGYRQEMLLQALDG
ncbi:hypothetical protein A9Z40_07630 [Microbacterium arborescens]|uniref:DUF2017 domain-containing protein n=1 Tax=Microbacterium arborescens TaxID=33883 RepID=A0ABX2WG74_9MICO|nr:DUF2017 family protein [Microbacterium arborescens]OAZ39689.1 hypothetical protein A9Z40_07630 [Microbacterium arborescens]